MRGTPHIVSLAFTCFGLFFFTIGLIIYSNTRNTLQGTIASQGRIVSCQMQRSTNNDKSVSYLCQPTVRFTTASGQTIEFVSSTSSNTFHKGDEVSVQYHPDDPENALISSFMSLWFLPLMFSGLGLLFFLIGLLLFAGPALLKLLRGEPQASFVLNHMGDIYAPNDANSPDISSSELQASNAVDSTDEIYTLAVSSTRGHYALDDANGPDISSGEPLAILIGNVWIPGYIEYSSDIYANQEKQDLFETPSGPDIIGGYYFIADDDGNILGLCAGMKVKRLC